MISRIFIATLVSTSLLAQPVLADHDHDDWRHDNGHHYGWNNKWDRYDHYPRSTVIYRTPRPQVDYVYMSNTRGPAYRQIRCTNDYNPLGLLLGGAAGGIVGHQIGRGKGNTAATIGGAVLGSAIGMGATTQHCSETIFEDSPIGVPISWQGDNDYYQVTPVRDYRTDGRYCREYQTHATVGGRTQDTYGTACMQPDGSWEIMN
jgi:surface antigen